MMNMNAFSLPGSGRLKGFGKGSGPSPQRRLGLIQQVETFLRTSAMSSRIVLGLAVQVRERGQADDAGEETEDGAVHRLRDALRQQVAFCDGSTPATPANDLIRPVMVPSRPARVARLPSIAR